jgi:hypothetical protein
MINFKCYLNIGKQCPYRFGIRFLNELWGSETSLSIGRFLRQDMASKSPFSLYLSGSGLLKALCRPSVGFQFWHTLLLLKINFPSPDGMG